MSDTPKTMTETMISRNNRVRVVDSPDARKAAQEALAEYRKISEDTIKDVKRITGIEQ